MDSKIKKCLKSYLTGKKYYNSDIDKSYQYFKQCAIILNDLKKNNLVNDDLIDILNETEVECNKYISDVLCLSIEQPLYKCDKTHDCNDKLFNIIETGDNNYLNNLKYGELNFKIYNEYGLTPLHYAIKYGDTTFIKNALKLGGLIDETNKFGNTLLEYACLEKDPNMINFLLQYGANMQKHLLFRESKIFFNTGNQIDSLLLQKYIMEIKNNLENPIQYLDWIYNYIDKTSKIDLEYADQSNITVSLRSILFEEFNKQLNLLLNILDNDSRETYINIIKEELEYNLSYKLGCPNNKIDLILYYLVPFINYENTFQLNWILSYEIKYIIFKILKNKKKINFKELKNNLLEILYESYIKNNIVSNGLIQIIILQWISKMNF